MDITHQELIYGFHLGNNCVCEQIFVLFISGFAAILRFCDSLVASLLFSKFQI